MYYQRIDMAGKRQGKLTVIKFAGINANGEATWFCKCDCGNELVVRGSHLRQGQMSCSKCSNADRNRRSAKHHMSTSK